MSEIFEFVNVNISLNDYYPSVPPFDVEAFIVDTDDVPIDVRVRVIRATDVEDLSDGPAADFATAYFSQDNAPDTLVLIRQAQTAISPAFICGDVNTTVATWEVLATASFTVTDSDANSTLVDLGEDPFDGVTTFAQIITVLNAGLAALVAPDVVGLDGATFAYDANGRLTLSMPSGQDDTDPTISITPSAVAGTVAYLLGVQAAGDGTSVPGNAVEDYLTAYNAGKILASFYCVAVADRIDNTGATIADAFDLAARVKLDKRQCTFVDVSDEAWDLLESGDLNTLLKVAKNECALVIFSEHDDEYPDAAADAKFLAEEPGVAAYGGRPLAGLTKASGSVGPRYDLTSTQKANLKAKGCNYVVNVDNNLFAEYGKTAAGKERRMVIAKHWLEVMIAADGFAYKMNQKSVLFDTTMLAFYDKTLRKYLDELGPKEKNGRGVIESYTIDLPELSDFTALDKSTNDVPMLEAFTAKGTYEGHTFELTGSITM